MPILQSDMQALVNVADAFHGELQDLKHVLNGALTRVLTHGLDPFQALREAHEYAQRTGVAMEHLQTLERHRAHIQVTRADNHRRAMRARLKRAKPRARVLDANTDHELAARVADYVAQERDHNERSLAELTIPRRAAEREVLAAQSATHERTYSFNDKTEYHVPENPKALQPEDLASGLDFEPESAP